MYRLTDIANDVQSYCAAQLHDSSFLKYNTNYRFTRCTQCSALFGSLYDREWSRKDINQLLVDYKYASNCSCGSPTCGEMARIAYASAYPMFASLFV